MFIFEWLRLNIVTSQNQKYKSTQILTQIKTVGKAKSGITAFFIFFEKPKSKEEYSHLALLFPLLTEA